MSTLSQCSQLLPTGKQCSHLSKHTLPDGTVLCGIHNAVKTKGALRLKKTVADRESAREEKCRLVEKRLGTDKAELAEMRQQLRTLAQSILDRLDEMDS